MNGQMQRIRTNTRRATPPHELRVVRSLAPDQPKLLGVIATLRETTSDIVRYKIKDEDRDASKLGVTVAMLGPLMRHMFGVGPGKRVPDEDLRQVEKDLVEHLAHTRDEGYDIGLDEPIGWPLGIYGTSVKYLGIRLDFRDAYLAKDRSMIEDYFRKGHSVSNNDMRKYLVKLRPHATIGALRTDRQLSYGDDADLLSDPSTFLLKRSLARQERVRELEGEGAVIPVVPPQEISLRGLEVFCQDRVA